MNEQMSVSKHYPVGVSAEDREIDDEERAARLLSLGYMIRNENTGVWFSYSPALEKKAHCKAYTPEEYKRMADMDVRLAPEDRGPVNLPPEDLLRHLNTLPIMDLIKICLDREIEANTAEGIDAIRKKVIATIQEEIQSDRTRKSVQQRRLDEMTREELVIWAMDNKLSVDLKLDREELLLACQSGMQEKEEAKPIGKKSREEIFLMSKAELRDYANARHMTGIDMRLAKNTIRDDILSKEGYVESETPTMMPEDSLEEFA